MDCVDLFVSLIGICLLFVAACFTYNFDYIAIFGTERRCYFWNVQYRARSASI